MTTQRADPLAFLDDEVAALRERHLYRPLRVMSSAQGPIVSIDERRLISLSSNDYLGLTHLQLGFDRDDTVASVRERYDGPVVLVEPGYETTIGG